MEESILGPEELPEFALAFAKSLRPGDWIFLEGELGAGKTTFMRHLMAADSDQRQDVSSPTFAILNSYPPSKVLGQTFEEVLHLDLYRLKSLSELLYLGLDMVVTERSLLVFEWPNRFSGDEWLSFLEQSGMPHPLRIRELQIRHLGDNPAMRSYLQKVFAPHQFTSP